MLRLEAPRTIERASRPPIFHVLQFSQGRRQNLHGLGIVFLPRQFARADDEGDSDHLIECGEGSGEGIVCDGLDGGGVVTGQVEGAAFQGRANAGCQPAHHFDIIG